MSRAQRRTSGRASARPRSSVDAGEVAKFAALAEAWWDPSGSFAPLHRLNPLRLVFIRSEAVRHFHRDARALAPFAGLSLLDIGCGGGLLAEPLARQGYAVLGVDAAAENVSAATVHARAMDAPVSYRCATPEVLATEKQLFDVVLNMEVIEHVADRSAFLSSCAAVTRTGGLMFVATINRTLKALILAKFGAEYVLGWIPRGTHDWNKFISPDVLSAELKEAGFSSIRVQGVSFDPVAWDWRFSSDTDVNYMLVATK